jgi:L-amino acid N-acyltransferase YncA
MNESLTGYPKSIDLAGEEITLRLFGAEDATGLQDFFLALDPSDLLFLQRDVTDGREIDAWVADVEAGNAVTLLALADGTVLGESTLHRSRVPWTRHVATVRVVTALAQRGRGLGRLLLDEMFSIAAAHGIEKIVAEMTVEQIAATRLFEQLGFREEGRFQSYVKDARGVPHDTIFMTRDQPALTSATRTSPNSGVIPWRCAACGHVTAASEQPRRCPDCGAAGEVLSAVPETS